MGIVPGRIAYYVSRARVGAANVPADPPSPALLAACQSVEPEPPPPSYLFLHPPISSPHVNQTLNKTLSCKYVNDFSKLNCAGIFTRYICCAVNSP